MATLDDIRQRQKDVEKSLQPQWEQWGPAFYVALGLAVLTVALVLKRRKRGKH